MKRKERLIVIANEFWRRPGEMINLVEFMERFSCAKSSISEDISELSDIFQKLDYGKIYTQTGKGGGVQFFPIRSDEANKRIVNDVYDKLANGLRAMVGGFLYTVDLFSDPNIVMELGEVLATHFFGASADVVVTIESKGVPIAMMTARALGLPLVVARKENRATEASLVTLNYQSESSRQLQSMSMPRRALALNQKVILIDDFVSGGGTMVALCEMMKEFDCSVSGIGCLVSGKEKKLKNGLGIKSIYSLGFVDADNKIVDIHITT